MAVHLMPTQRGRRCLVASLLLGAACATWALGPAAPFAPPRGVLAQGANDASISPPADNSGLTGLRLRSHPMALIDGQWLRVGATVRNARLTSIGSAGAVLRHADGRTELLPWNRIAADGASNGELAASTTLRTSP